MSASTQDNSEYFGGRPQSEIHQFLCDASDSFRACASKPVALALDKGVDVAPNFAYVSGKINDRHVVFQVQRHYYTDEQPGWNVGFDSDGNKYHGNVTKTTAPTGEKSLAVHDIQILNQKAQPLFEILKKIQSDRLFMHMNREIEADGNIRYIAFKGSEKSLVATFPDAESERGFLGKDVDGVLSIDSVMVTPLHTGILLETLQTSASLEKEVLATQDAEKSMSAQSQTSTSQKAKPHFNTRVANQLSQQLRDGTAPMQRQGVQDIPYNPATGRTFHGINAMSLMMQGRKDGRWFSFDDASACGYKVKSGEKGTPVQKWPRKKPGETMNKAITAYVFNAEQLDRIPPQTLKPERPDPVARVNDLLKNSGMTVIHDQAERSFYAPRKDEIHLPKPENCKSKEDYCEKAIYEYMKATGHPDRQNRETWNAVSANDRAKEELICTTATMMMCAEMGIPHDSTRNPEHALDWGKSMEHHPFEFAKAMQQADTAVFTTLRQEQAMNAEIGFQSNEPWRPVPEASPAVAVQTFMRQNEVVEISKTEPEKLHSFEFNNREIYALPDTGVILGKRGDIEDDGRVDMKVKTDAYDREGNTYSVVMNYTVAMNENGMAALTAPAQAEEIQLTTRQMALPIDWEGTLEVRGCADDMDGTIRSDITDPAQIQFYGVYANTKDGTQQHLADFDTEAQAKRYAQLVDNEYSHQAKHETVQEQPRTPEREAAPEQTRADTPEPEPPQRDDTAKGYTLDDDQKKELVDKAKEHVEKRDDDLKATYDKTAKRLKSQVKRFETPKEQTPYMKTNDVQLHPGVYQNGNSTCVPLYNNNGEMRSMAYIQEDSTTRFAKNSDRQGCYHIIGGQEAMKKAPVGIIANEYATAARISESVGLPVMATVGNDNLVDAAKEFRAANPDKPLIIAADRNAEIEAGLAAAAISAAIVLPAVADKAMEKEVNSFNDLARVHGELGKDAIKGQLQPAIDKETSRKVEKTQEHEAKVEKQRGQELARA